MVEHPDRVLFGSDAFGAAAADYRILFRLLETDDESFAYSREQVPPQGRWSIDGLGLPSDVLSAVYRDNAHRMLERLTRR